MVDSSSLLDVVLGRLFGGGTVIVAVMMSHDGSNKYDPSPFAFFLSDRF